jgi:hypothetical protein
MATQAATKVQRRGAAGRFRVVATNAAYARICRRSLKKLPARFRNRIDLQVFSSLDEVTLPPTRAATVYISRLADLPEDGANRALLTAGESKHLLFLESLPVEAMPARLLQLNIRNPHRLHLAAERSSHLMVELIYRLFRGMARADGPRSIVDAWVEIENLVLLSPGFDRLVVPRKDLAKFIGTKAEKIAAFEIDEDGRFLFWPHADVHLGWEQFVQIVDPAAAVAAKQRSHEFNERYGAAIRALREQHGLKQSDIRGVTERHLRRVEHGEQTASKGTLEALASAHGVTLDAYLRILAERLSDTTPRRSAAY